MLLILLILNIANAEVKMYANDGTFLGNVNNNVYDPDSISNPYGKYGNLLSPDSIKNQYNEYSNPFSPDSINNPYYIPKGNN